MIIVCYAPLPLFLNDLDCTFPVHHFIIDASYYGDFRGDARNVYLFGFLDPSRFLSFLFPSESTTIGLRYSACGWCAVDDHVGFQQVFDIPGSMGKEIRLRWTQGNWIYSQHSLATALSAKATLNSGRRWPLLSETGASPSAGQRIVVLGGIMGSPA